MAMKLLRLLSADIMDDPFQVSVKIDNPGDRPSLPLTAAGIYSMIVDWGDGSDIQKITAYNVNNAHTYAAPGFYTISLWGTCTHWDYVPPSPGWPNAAKVLNFVDLGFTKFNFYACSNLNEIASNMNRLTHVTDGYYMFTGTGLATIPAHSFDGMTNLSGMEQAFATSSLTTLPDDVFLYNTAIGSFYGCFYQCTSLATVPQNLFRTQINCIDFQSCFKDCAKLQQNKNIFYADGEQGTRFKNLNNNFEECFSRASFSGTQGTAPDLWNCDFGPSVITRKCWKGAGNSLTSLDNYASIPAAWIA